jgi:hypothetical protein
MKHVSSFAAGAIALAFAAAPAWAQDSAFITQYESAGNTAVIEQVASFGNNYATIDQMSPAYYGSGNLARLLQQGVGNSTASIYQSGQMNDHTILQHDGQGLRATINAGGMGYYEPGGEFNTVLIDQSGFDSGAWVNVSGHSSYNRAEIVQGWGGQNQASISQYYTNNNLASIYQAGSNLTGVINQAGGGGNVATIRQGY